MVSGLDRAAALLSTLLALASTASALGARRLLPPALPAIPLPPAAQAGSSSKSGTFNFTQLIDHENPGLGTFGQRVWWNAEFWGGPGSPVVLFTPGESEASGFGGYLTNRTLPGLIAQNVSGAVIIVEHRYYGESSPYADLTAKNMEHLTLKNSIEDFVYLANTACLPFDPTNSSNAHSAPWVFTGGSYAGSLAAWTESTRPGTFWAYHASSAPVQTISDYWQYFAPVKLGMPKNCSTDVSRVISYVDKVFKHGSKREQVALKEKFGLGKLRNDDFAGVLEFGPWEEQSNNFYTPSPLTAFCDQVEGAKAGDAKLPSAAGVGLHRALEGYATWVRESLVPNYCQAYGYEDPLSIECFDTYNPQNKMFTDRGVYNAAYRQWEWMLCNEPFGWWQDGAPRGHDSLVSTLITASYWSRQCALFFPASEGGSYGLQRGLTPDAFNAYTGGWAPRKSQRLIYANGEFDPWRTAGVSSEFRPGGALRSTKEVPVQVIPGGFHCSDLILKNYDANGGVRRVVDEEVRIIRGWVGEFYEGKEGRGVGFES